MHQRVEIICNGHPAAITENLFSALHRMYDQFGSKAIWIDQICIDQNNLEERSNQVQIMGSIFQKAKQVVVWLGEEENDSDSGFELAKRSWA
jgi:hypothetical protein